MHLEAAQAPADLVAIPADIPEDVSRTALEVRRLPTDWRAYPAPASQADLGTRWIREGRTALLVVPSAVIPAEWNYLINPRHPDVKAIRLGPPTPFSFDPRMSKR